MVAKKRPFAVVRAWFSDERRVVAVLLLLSLFLRFWDLGSTHPLSEDEAAIGYEAYSILKTGKDTHGVAIPFLFEAAGDNKLPLSVYSTIPFVGLLGLSKFAVRLPAVLMGVASVLLVYLLARMIFDRDVAAASALLLAVSPWHIILSSRAYEVDYYIFLMVAGVYCCYRSLAEGRFIVCAAVCFGLSLYATLKAEVISPLLFFGFVAWFSTGRGRRMSPTGATAVSIGVFLLFAAPIVYYAVFHGDEFMTRYNQAGLKDSGIAKAPTVLGEYVRYQTDFLYVDRCHTSAMSPFARVYHFQLPFIMVGVYWILRRELRLRERSYLVFWLLASPLAASLAYVDLCSPYRFVESVFVLQVLTAYGFFVSVRALTRPKDADIVYAVSLVVVAFAAAAIYYAYYAVEERNYVGYGLEKGLGYALEHRSEYDEVGAITWERLTLLFHARIDPAEYQKAGLTGYRMCGYTKSNRYGLDCGYQWDYDKRTLFIFPNQPLDERMLKLKKTVKIPGTERVAAWIYEYTPQANVSGRREHMFRMLPQ
jgi:4-amino-4-deoxy-L-arabinose transferase-like glycosyltransferase